MYARIRIAHEGLVEFRKSGTPCFPNRPDTGRVFAISQNYDGANMNVSSDDEVNNDEVSPNPPTNDVNIGANYDDEKNDYVFYP